MNALRAEERLRSEGGKLTAAALRELVMEATGDQDQADTAYCERMLANNGEG